MMTFLAAEDVKYFAACSCGAPLTTEGRWTVLEGDVQIGIHRFCQKCIEKAHPELVPILAELDEIGVLPPLNYGQRLGVVVGATAADIGLACNPLECRNAVIMRRFEQCLLPLGGSSAPHVWCVAHRDERVANEPLTAYLHKLNKSSPYVAPPAPVPPPPSAEEIQAAKREAIRMNIARALALQTETGKKISPFDASVMLLDAIDELIRDAK